MTPTTPMSPAQAMKAKVSGAMSQIDQDKAKDAAKNSALGYLDKFRAAGAGEATADNAQPGPGEKAWSIKTAKDPQGTMHVYAKDQNEAKKKYTDLGSPLGTATNAEEVKEDFEDAIGKQVKKFVKKGMSMRGDYADSNWDDKPFNPDAEEKKPYSNYVKAWERPDQQVSKASSTSSNHFHRHEGTDLRPFYIFTNKDRSGSTVIMAKSQEEARKIWNTRYSKSGEKLLRINSSPKMDENMEQLKTTFEGIEDSVAEVLESFGLENGRDFYIDGTIKTLDEQVAQDILSVLADHEMPGQAYLRNLGEQWSISLIGQGEELVENLTVGDDAIEVRHIGEGVVRVYVNNELAEQFETGTAAFKYVKALQENLAEAEQELMSAITAEAGEDLMKVSNITEGWEDMLKAVKDRDDKKVGDKWKTSKGEVTKTSTGVIHTRSYDPKTGETDEEKPKDADGNPVKRGRGRPKKVRESIAALREMRKQVSEALSKIEALPEEQRNTPQVQAMVDRLTESVRLAIAKAK